MPKKYARFLPTADSFNLEDFPFYWISQVNAQYVQNIDNVLKKYGLDYVQMAIQRLIGFGKKAEFKEILLCTRQK